MTPEWKMRLAAALLASIVPMGARAAQGDGSSSSVSRPSTEQDAGVEAQPDDLDLPVSLDRIREALRRSPSEPLRGLQDLPRFYMEVNERRRIEELLATLKFKAEPVPPQGLYAYEVQRNAFPAVSRPLMQPYAAFNQGELLTVLVENLVGKYFAGRALRAITSAEHEWAEAAAREEVDRAIKEYCGAQLDRAREIRLCTSR